MGMNSVDSFPVKLIKATSIDGFLVKLKLFILAYSIDRFFKLHSSLRDLAFN
jgi:hypothetical protein